MPLIVRELEFSELLKLRQRLHKSDLLRAGFSDGATVRIPEDLASEMKVPEWSRLYLGDPHDRYTHPATIEYVVAGPYGPLEEGKDEH